ncbi:unnamed protein product [Alopecurus aequalis]
MAEEDSFHAVAACTKARALREKMRELWDLPPESLFRHTGEDWLLLLLDFCNKDQRSRILMLLWRAWHLRCDVIHGKGEETIAHSASFLLSYGEHLWNHTPIILDDNKGKRPVLQVSPLIPDRLHDTSRDRSLGHEQWTPPREGTIKINVDAAFSPESGKAAIGVVARDHAGGIVAAISRTVGTCRDAEEAEATAILAGIQLGINHDMSISALVSDCAIAVANVNNPGSNSSELWGLYEEIKRALALLPMCCVSFTRRKLNKAAHELARLASRSSVSNLWLHPCPTFVVNVANQDFVNCAYDD